MKSNDVLKIIRQDSKIGSKVLLSYLNEIFEEQGFRFKAVYVNTESSTALNSINGQCILENHDKLFFKFHSEENETELDSSDLYKSGLLLKNNWPVLRPIATSNLPGKQCVLYPWIESQTVYTLLLSEDIRFLESKCYTNKLSSLITAIEKSTKIIGEAMVDSLYFDSNCINSPIHQLFSYRLNPRRDEVVRIQSFYDELKILNFFNKYFVVNGYKYPYSINKIFSDSKDKLNANCFHCTPSIVAHGDEHFANQYYINDEILIFDPAFASRMPALLAPIKATAHNICAHPFWLYEEKLFREFCKFTIEEDDNDIFINHNFLLYSVESHRSQILDCYLKNIWNPLLMSINKKQGLPKDLFEIIFLALFCSSSLAKNFNLISKGDYRINALLFGFNISNCYKVAKQIVSTINMDN